MTRTSSAPRTIIVTACDELYASLAKDLFASIGNLTFKAVFDLGLIDAGLSVAKREAFERLPGLKVVSVQSDIEYPARAYWEAKKPGVRTLTAQPFLPRYFPGYDLYIWLDADVWMQTPEAIETMIASASSSPAIFLACEFDRCYSAFFHDAQIWQRFREWYDINFGPEVAAHMTLKPMLNVGVFALSSTSPIWEAWASIYTESLQKVTELSDKSFMAHQLGLNILLYQKGLPCTLLPSSYNWMTYYAIPMFDRATGLFVEPLPPYRPISQIHLTRTHKNIMEKVTCLDGTVIDRRLTFSGDGA